MRLGTWNLAGRWSDAHLEFLLGLDCDVLLLTEVSERVDVPGHHLHLSDALMAPRRRWGGDNATLKQLGPVVPTAELPHQIDGLLSIDHIGVPQGTRATATTHSVLVEGGRHSDHDAYVVEV